MSRARFAVSSDFLSGVTEQAWAGPPPPHPNAYGINEKRFLVSTQFCIRYRMNGMAGGGRRRMVIHPSQVCSDLDEYSPTGSTCFLMATAPGSRGIRVPKKQLIVKATLTKSCIPIHLSVVIWPFYGDWDVACRDHKGPRLDPKAPIWKFY